MDQILKIKIDNILNELQNQLTKEYIDTSTAKSLMSFAITRINLLLTHVGYLEKKLESTIESNQAMAVNAENLIAENQRLSQIARY